MYSYDSPDSCGVIKLVVPISLPPQLQRLPDIPAHRNTRKRHTQGDTNTRTRINYAHTSDDRLVTCRRTSCPPGSASGFCARSPGKKQSTLSTACVSACVHVCLCVCTCSLYLKAVRVVVDAHISGPHHTRDVFVLHRVHRPQGRRLHTQCADMSIMCADYHVFRPSCVSAHTYAPAARGAATG